MLPSDEINEKNIDKVLNYLRIFHPDKATPEMAIHILETMSVNVHMSVVHGKKVDLEKAIEQALAEMDKGKS